MWLDDYETIYNYQIVFSLQLREPLKGDTLIRVQPLKVDVNMETIELTDFEITGK